MTWMQVILDCLKDQQIQTVVHVPDIVLSGLIRMAEGEPSLQVISATREEEGVGVLCGAYLGGRRGVLMMQNSGLGNAVNALASLVTPYHFPLLLLISNRGGLGEFNSAQVGMGQALRPLLDALDIPHFSLEREDEVERIVTGACKLAFSTDRPVAVILSTLMTGGKQL